MTTETFNVNMPIDRNQLLCVISNAFDYGIGYWAEIVETIPAPANADRSWIDKTWTSLLEPGNCRLAPIIGGAVRIRTRDSDEDEGRQVYTLDAAALQRGLSKMATAYPRHFADFMSENDDATTADVLVQLALFDDLIFG